jgi:hypothetical protein
MSETLISMSDNKYYVNLCSVSHAQAIQGGIKVGKVGVHPYWACSGQERPGTPALVTPRVGARLRNAGVHEYSPFPCVQPFPRISERVKRVISQKIMELKKAQTYRDGLVEGWMCLELSDCPDSPGHRKGLLL